MNSRVLAVGMIVLVCAGPPAAQAQRVSIDAALHTMDKPYVQATGEATVSAKPDQALIDIGVVTQGATAMVASAQNAKQTDAVLADLRRLLGGSNRIRTVSYSVRPNYQYPKPGAAAITGYVATNIVEVTLDDLAEVSKVIDGATQSGANTIQNLEFRLKNPGVVRGQALREAAEQAKASAEAIASGLGLRAVRVLSAEEVMPGEDFGMAKKKAPPPPPPGTVPATPMEVGMIDVVATVTVRVEIGQ